MMFQALIRGIASWVQRKLHDLCDRDGLASSGSLEYRVIVAYGGCMGANTEQLAELQTLYPGLTDGQFEEIQGNFERYVEIATRVVELESAESPP